MTSLALLSEPDRKPAWDTDALRRARRGALGERVRLRDSSFLSVVSGLRRERNCPRLHPCPRRPPASGSGLHSWAEQSAACSLRRTKWCGGAYPPYRNSHPRPPLGCEGGRQATTLSSETRRPYSSPRGPPEQNVLAPEDGLLQWIKSCDVREILFTHENVAYIRFGDGERGRIRLGDTCYRRQGLLQRRSTQPDADFNKIIVAIGLAAAAALRNLRGLCSRREGEARLPPPRRDFASPVSGRDLRCMHDAPGRCGQTVPIVRRPIVPPGSPAPIHSPQRAR